MKIRKKSIKHYILLYLLLASQGSVVFSIYQNQILIMFLIIGILFIINGHLKYRKTDITIFLIALLTVYLLFVRLYTGGSMSLNSIGRIISILIFTYFVYCYDEQNTVDRYVKIVIFFSIISILTFIIQIVSPTTLYNVLPDYLGTGMFYGGIFTTVVKSHITRSCGLATEPGRHQIYLIVALFFLLFRRNKVYCTEKRKNFFVCILVITIAIAQSTTGYLALILLLLFFLTQRNSIVAYDNKYTKWIKRILWCGLFLTILYAIIGGVDTFIYRNLITKIFSNGRINLFQNTGSSRMGSILTDINLALKNPIGMGFNNYQQEWIQNKMWIFIDNSSCSGLTIFLASCGFIGTFLLLCIYWYNCNKNVKKPIEKVLMWLLLLNLSLGQPSLYFAPMLLMFFVKEIDLTRYKENEISN